MNKERRIELQLIIDMLNDAKQRIENVKGEEQDAYDSLPENLQQSQGDDVEEAMNNLDDAIDSIDGAIDSIMSAM